MTSHRGTRLSNASSRFCLRPLCSSPPLRVSRAHLPSLERDPYVIRGRRCGDGVFERCPLAAGTVGYQRDQRGEGVGHGELLAVALVGAQALASNRPDKALVMLVATSGGQPSAGSASCPASTSAKSSSNTSSHLLKHTQRRPAGERDEQPDAKRPAVGGRGVLATFDDVGSRYPWMRYSAVDGATLLAASEPGGGRVQRPSL